MKTFKKWSSKRVQPVPIYWRYIPLSKSLHNAFHSHGWKVGWTLWHFTAICDVGHMCVIVSLGWEHFLVLQSNEHNPVTFLSNLSPKSEQLSPKIAQYCQCQEFEDSGEPNPSQSWWSYFARMWKPSNQVLHVGIIMQIGNPGDILQDQSAIFVAFPASSFSSKSSCASSFVNFQGQLEADFLKTFPPK